MASEQMTPDRTVDDVLRDLLIIHSGRTRYHGQKPRDDEMLVAEIQRLRSVLTEIATGCDTEGMTSDFPRDLAADALSIVPGEWPPRRISNVAA